MTAKRRSHWGRAEPIGTADRTALFTRDRRVNPLTVICPDCHADIGEPCRRDSETGKAHIPRRRMALRLLNETTLGEPHA